MKTQTKLVLLVCSLWLVQSCTHDDLNTSSTTPQAEEVKTWKPEDGIRKFIPQEYLGNVRVQDLDFIERFLKNPMEEGLSSRSNEIHIPAGSINALSTALTTSNNGDVIILDPGSHTESGTITLDKSISLIGYGATVTFSGTSVDALSHFAPAIHVKERGCISTIRGITFKSSEALPGICIFLDNTKDIKILNNTFENWIIGVAMYNSNYNIVSSNTINANPGWQTIPGFNSQGVAIADGHHNMIIDNEIKGALFGIFTGGSLGIDFRNHTSGCAWGQILCKVTPDAITVGGTLVSTQTSSNNWLVMFNKSDHNFLTGIIVIDGAYKNYVSNNEMNNNAVYDIELAGASTRFGYPTPSSYDNRVNAYYNMKIKDCGDDNKIHGGSLVNNTLDPCN
ncbi:MAG: right-handed parallel beta-helix repeat-containing protein [Saprospiraceae bacterium]